jgi:hypothetical protein
MAKIRSLLSLVPNLVGLNCGYSAIIPASAAAYNISTSRASPMGSARRVVSVSSCCAKANTAVTDAVNSWYNAPAAIARPPGLGSCLESVFLSRTTHDPLSIDTSTETGRVKRGAFNLRLDIGETDLDRGKLVASNSSASTGDFDRAPRDGIGQSPGLGPKCRGPTSSSRCEGPASG